jgi:hypothetical protein
MSKRKRQAPALPRHITSQQLAMIQAAQAGLGPEKCALFRERLAARIEKDLAMVHHPRDADIERALRLSLVGLS